MKFILFFIALALICERGNCQLHIILENYKSYKGHRFYNLSGAEIFLLHEKKMIFFPKSSAMEFQSTAAIDSILKHDTSYTYTLIIKTSHVECTTSFDRTFFPRTGKFILSIYKGEFGNERAVFYKGVGYVSRNLKIRRNNSRAYNEHE